jgi:glycosyltransferase 2 family protein
MTSLKQYRHLLQSGYLRIIGIALFVWILSRIDLNELSTAIRNADVFLILSALLLQILVYNAKTLRWHTIVHTTSARPSLFHSWCVYHIGVFLATITPGKLGELGKAAYLTKEGVPPILGIALVIIDRLSDVIAIVLIGAFSVGILFGVEWFLIACAGLLIACAILWVSWKKIPACKRIISASLSLDKKIVVMGALYTFISWILYFGWAILLAFSVGITVSIPVLIAAFTITGILSLLPIAPAGLGTRDAAMLLFLAPFGVVASQAVALALLMFCSILLMGIPGGICWIIRKR